MSSDTEHDYVIETEREDIPDLSQFTTPTDIRDWMEAKAGEFAHAHNVKDATPRGRFYVAKTIEYKSEAGLTQTGSAPGFHGGTWSLATCKKTMRGYGTVDDQFWSKTDDGVRIPKYPFFVAVFGSRDPDRYHGTPPGVQDHQNWLASVALVTAGFEQMDEMADYILENHSESALLNRRTAAEDSTPRASNRGDLHVDGDHSVVYPPAEHQHGPNETNTSSHCGCSHEETPSQDPLDHEDNQHDHIKLVADPGDWITWKHPTFAFKGGLEQGNRKLDGKYEPLTSNLSIIR
jgi:hypothetical protein